MDCFEQLQLYSLKNSSDRKVGDVVIYDIDNNLETGYEHAAIISIVNTSDMKLDKVISTFGYSEHFKWGAKETVLWVFHSSLEGGVFLHVSEGGKWISENDNWNLDDVKIYRLN